MSVIVNSDNFVRVENERMLHDLQRDAGGINCFLHNSAPADIAKQMVIRLNRDTHYSFAVVDFSQGATFTIPEYGHRYLSAMVVNQDHFINRTFHAPGQHLLTVEEFGSPYVVLAVRTVVPPLVQMWWPSRWSRTVSNSAVLRPFRSRSRIKLRSPSARRGMRCSSSRGISRGSIGCSDPATRPTPCAT